jgi:hypothetical protein
MLGVGAPNSRPQACGESDMIRRMSEACTAETGSLQILVKAPPGEEGARGWQNPGHSVAFAIFNVTMKEQR